MYIYSIYIFLYIDRCMFPRVLGYICIYTSKSLPSVTDIKLRAKTLANDNYINFAHEQDSFIFFLSLSLKDK